MASDGSEALRVFEEQAPEIVIVETGLPGTPGLDICTQIKSNPNLGHVKVLLLVGPRESLGEVELSRVRPDGILRKPLDPATVARTVQELALIKPTVDSATGAAVDKAEDDGQQEQSAGDSQALQTAGSNASSRENPHEADPFAAAVEDVLRERATTNIDREQIRHAVAEVMEFVMPSLIDRVTDRVLELLRKETGG